MLPYILLYYISKIIEIEGEIRSDLAAAAAAAAAVYICPEVASREKYHKSLGEI